MTFLAVAALVVGVAPWVAPLARRPTLVVVLALAAVLYARTVVHLLNAPIASNLDDAATGAVLALGVIAATNRGLASVRRFPGASWFTLFAAAGVISGLANGVPLGTLADGTWLALKGVLFGWAVAQLDWETDDIRRLVRFAAINGVVCIVAAGINFVTPRTWASVFSVNGGEIFRYGLPSLSGPFIHPFDLAFVCGFTFIGALLYRRYFGRSLWNTFITAGSAFALIGSFRRKDLIGTMLGLGVVAVHGRRWGSVLGGLMLVSALVVAAYGPISGQISSIQTSYLNANSKEARTVLTVRSFDVASEYLPLGAGFGRYASRAAADTYSPEYTKYGFEHVYGLGSAPGTGAFLTDTSWPAVIGESGYLGLFGFAAGLLAMLRFLLKARQGVASPHVQWLAATTLGCFILYLVESSGAAVFTSPPAFPFAFCLIGILVAAKAARPLAGNGAST